MITDKEESETERTKEIINVFSRYGINDLRLFALKTIDQFDISPDEFCAIMISLIESFLICHSKVRSSKFKEIVDMEERQKFVDIFSMVFYSNFTSDRETLLDKYKK